MTKLGWTGAVLAATTTAATAAGCGTAPGTEQGGEPLIVGPEAGGDDGGEACPPKQHRWQDLYACYFGPTGQASCTAAGICHGDKTMLGAMSSGYVCGHSADECYKGMTAAGSIVPAGGAADPTTTPIYIAIRKFDGTGSMPKNSTFVFSQQDVGLISAWILEGAQEN